MTTPREYRNPVLPADYADPDVVRVGDDYYLTASTFNRAPGLPVLHSRDLVHWGLLGHALPRVEPAGHFALPRHGGGVWAPAIRHHDGRFFIVWGDPDHGTWVVTATDPAGPWTPPHLLWHGRGRIDPCLFWDDDGRAYLVHAWSLSRAGINNRLTVQEVTPDARELIGPGRTVVDAREIPGFDVLEGPKMLKRDGWYWIVAPAGTVPGGWQSVFRARSIWGPYEERTVLAQGSSPVNGPHQGGLVDAPDGSSWFLHFQQRAPFGRVVHLQPVTWDDDGWPRMGTAAAAPGVEGVGEPVPTHPVPPGDPAGTRGGPLGGSDDWRGGLAPFWYWQANPVDGWAGTVDGTLRLPLLGDDHGNLRDQGRVLGQRLPMGRCTARVTLHLEDAVVGARAGLVVLGREYAWAGLVRTPFGVALTTARGGWSPVEQPFTVPTALEPDARVELEVGSDDGALTFRWRVVGGQWAVLPGEPRASLGDWIGAEVGLFGTGPTGSEPGHAVFGPFTFETGQPGWTGSAG